MSDEPVEEERRFRHDAILKELLAKTSEIHQRQQESVIPKLDKIHETVYGNGKQGLCELMSIHNEKISRLEECSRRSGDRLPVWIAIVISFVASFWAIVRSM